MADLYTKLNEVQKKLQGINATMIEACIVLLRFHKSLANFNIFQPLHCSIDNLKIQHLRLTCLFT